jgi:hypothetical protein
MEEWKIFVDNMKIPTILTSSMLSCNFFMEFVDQK